MNQSELLQQVARMQRSGIRGNGNGIKWNGEGRFLDSTTFHPGYGVGVASVARMKRERNPEWIKAERCSLDSTTFHPGYAWTLRNVKWNSEITINGAISA